ncbi:hypothetical protein [Methylocella sp.]|jgi:hypothetical protein|uniref:hypothetical protein n=1 Tax=Methylocella sp. TaxID=1978226 RepID=UPI003C1DE7BF
MRKNMARAFAAAILLCSAMGTSASCQIFGLLQEEADCEGDAFRFCAQYIANHAQIHACLYAYRNAISPACRAIIVPPKHRRR